jgi:hypothetical protein
VNSTIRLWNSTFGGCEDTLEYPPRVLEALLRLRSVADLRLPSFPEAQDESAEPVGDRQPLDFAETQNDRSYHFGSHNLSALLRKNPSISQDQSPYRKFTPQVIIGSSISAHSKRAREETPEPGYRKSKKRVSTPKLRHDDSQIQFEAIESSPIVSTTMDSQLLTERQREVKERQQTEAAMFPDIRSSPRPRSSGAQRRTPLTTDLPSHHSDSKADILGSSRSKRPTTPTVLPQVDYDEHVNSSPTPTRSLPIEEDLSGPPSSPLDDSARKPLWSFTDDADIPSSPPEMTRDLTHAASASGHDTITSAQIDPFAVLNNDPISTFESTIERQDVPSTRETRSPLPTKVILQTSDTPSREGTPTAQQTPRSLIFHDALESPVSSDQISANGEVFQDSLSSPVADMELPKKSSSISDLDESSMIRLMTEFDDRSGRPQRNISAVGLGNETVPEQVDSSIGSQEALKLADENPLTPEDVPHNSRDVESSDVPAVHQEHRLASDISHKPSSSMPSLIPETPGATSRMPTRVEGADFEDGTIVVAIPDDFSDLLNRHLKMPSGKHIVPRKSTSPKKKPSPMKRISVGRRSIGSPTSKRKYRQIEEETPGNLEIKVERK